MRRAASSSSAICSSVRSKPGSTLLLAIENGEVSLQMSNLPINAVMIASSNELHLSAFRQHPEYNSFRGRIVRIRMSYLLDVHREREIYDGQIVPQIPKHVAPHTTYVAALWSVLTRLRKPDASQFTDSELGTIAASLTPLEKADLLADGLVPARFEADQGKILAGGIEEVELQGASSSDYEGINGASPREIRMLLLDAAANFDEPCVSPVTFLSRLTEFCDRDDYEFLKEQPDGAYRDHSAFVDVVKERWLDIVEGELRAASGLIDEQSHLGLFDRYITHVSHWVKKERLFNPVTGQDEEADVDLMKSVETKLGSDDATAFRNELLSGIAAWAIDHPEQDVDYEALFPRYIEQLRQAYFDERRGQVGEIGRPSSPSSMRMTSSTKTSARPPSSRSRFSSVSMATSVRARRWPWVPSWTPATTPEGRRSLSDANTPVHCRSWL